MNLERTMSRNTARIIQRRTGASVHNDASLRLVPQQSQETPQQQGELVTAKVTDRQEEAFTVIFESGGSCAVRRAAGCVLLPDPGDTVLVYHAPQGQSWMLQVLEKAASTWKLQCPADLELGARDKRCAIKGNELDIDAVQTRVRFLGLELTGGALNAKVQHIRSVAGSMTTFTRRCTAVVGRMLRTSGFEQHKARQLRTEVEGRMTTRCGQASIVAEEDVSIDGSTINLG